MSKPDKNGLVYQCMAMHEASHAVVATKLKLTVTKVSLSRSGGCVYVKEDPCFEYLAVTMAGYMGEALWLKHRHGMSESSAMSYAKSNGAAHDLRLFKQYSGKLGVSRGDAEKAALKILRSERGRIEKLGNKLVKSGSLSPFWDL